MRGWTRSKQIGSTAALAQGVISVLFCLLCTPKTWADETHLASQLLNFFGSTCSSYGEWTKTAQAQAQALVEGLRALKDDPNCQGSVSAMSQVNLMQSQLANIQVSQTERDFNVLNRQEQDLMLALSTATSDIDRALIRGELRYIQLQQARYSSYIQAENSYLRLGRRAEMYRALVGNTNTLYRQVSSEMSCWSKHPGVLMQVSSIAASVASAFVTSSWAFPMASGVELAANVIEFIRQWRVDNAISRLSAASVATAFECSVESFSRQWCNARDAITAVDLKIRSMTMPEPQDEITLALQTLNQTLPALLSWLEEVYSGTEATSHSHLARRQQALSRLEKVRANRDTASALVHENAKPFELAGTPQDRWVVERRVIGQILRHLAQPAANGSQPFLEVYSLSYAPYYLLGIPRALVPKHQNGEEIRWESFDPFVHWPDEKSVYLPDLQSIQSRYRQWYERTQNLVNSELTSVLQIDPLKVMADSLNPDRSSPYRVSAEQAVRRIIEYLNLSQAHSQLQDQITKDTLSRLKEIHALMQESSKIRSSAEALSSLQRVYELAQLEYGTQFLSQRVARALRSTLSERLASGKAPESSLGYQLLAAEDIVKELQLLSGREDLPTLKDDPLRAQSTVQNTMNGFTDLFQKKIKDSLEHYDKQAKQSREGSSGPNVRSKAALCFKLTTLPVWPKKIPRKLCLGTQMRSGFAKGPNGPVLTDEYLNQPFEKRVCTPYELVRKVGIYQRYCGRPENKQLCLQ